MISIEALLSAHLFLIPQLHDHQLLFYSNMHGHLSLYEMPYGGGTARRLLPEHIALQNPKLIDGYSFCLFPKLDKILLMIDQDGDENYQPVFIPRNGGTPEHIFGDALADYQVVCEKCDTEQNIIYMTAQSLRDPMCVIFRGNLETRTLEQLGASPYMSVGGVDQQHSRVILLETYTSGDHALFLWQQASNTSTLLYGTPLAERTAGQEIPLNAIYHCWFTQHGILCTTALFQDTYSLGYLHISRPQEMTPVTIGGTLHEGQGHGELVRLEQIAENRYTIEYNIDGVSWLYEGQFDETTLHMQADTLICGAARLADGVLEAVSYDKTSNRFALAFSTATSPTHIYTIEGADRATVVNHTQDYTLDIAADLLSSGEDASFTSFDGLRVSARLYFPATSLGFALPRPLVYYVHGGPQGQERPDFAWFSMPLIQFLTLQGFAVFVPNVRGSSGYGLDYMKKVDRDWGGDDRRDHVHAMHVLAQDERIDIQRAAVMGRSYGGYMTLMLAARHPELWSAAVDMFGPYDLLTFMQRIPETWKPYFTIAVGDPATDRDFLVERSPRTYIDQITCPMLIIQGKNDPRVVEQESHDVAEQLRTQGKPVEYLVFEDEGHDVLKFENRVRCYNAITHFFKDHLQP